MTEYINRGELIIGLQKDYDAIFGRKPDFYNGYQIACRFVENFQTADVAPVRRGRWLTAGSNIWWCSADRKLYMLGAAAHSQSCKKRKENDDEAD